MAVAAGDADQPVSPLVSTVKVDVPKFRKPPSVTPLAVTLVKVAVPGPCAWTTKVPTLVTVSPSTVTVGFSLGPRNWYAAYALLSMVLPERLNGPVRGELEGQNRTAPVPKKNPGSNTPQRCITLF